MDHTAIDDLKKQIAEFASKLFGTDISISSVSNRSVFLRGQCRIYEAFVVNANYDDLISDRSDNYIGSYTLLLKKIQNRIKDT